MDNQTAVDTISKKEAFNPMQLMSKKTELKPELVSIANKNLQGITNFDFDNIDKQIDVENSIDSLGVDLQREVAHKSSLLTSTIGDLSSHTESGDLAKSLMYLRDQVEVVNPNKYKLEPGSITRFIGKVFPSIIARPMKNYMTKFRTAESVINEIVQGISEGQRMLERDNTTLQDKVVELRKLDQKLHQAVQIGQVMDDDLVSIIDKEQDPEKKKFYKQKVLVKLRTRIVDLQTVRTVAQQGVLSMDLTIDTNKQLVQNAERTRTVTVAALKIAVELRKALTNQKQMLEIINSVNETTNNIILGNSQVLKDNATLISKGAMESTLDLEKLKTAFNNIYSAIDEVERYKEEALPRLKDTITQFNSLSDEAEKKIRDMESSKRLENKVNLKLT